MGYDFSELDTELAALGAPPANAVQLAHAYAGTPRSLAEADAALDALGSYTPQPLSAPAPIAARLAESGEIALPAPVPSEAPKSSEVALDAETPHSGSFALSDLEDDDADFEAEFAALAAPDPVPAAPEHTSVAAAPVARELAPAAPEPDLTATEVAPAAPEPEHPPAAESPVDDDPLLALFDSDDGELEPLAAAPLSSLSVAPAPAPTALRDPDAEFDALFEEATRPSDLPPSFEDAPLLETSADADFDDELDDPTNIVDRASLAELNGKAAVPPAQGDGRGEGVNGFADDDELPSSEFEIVLEEDEVEEAPKSRPPPPPPIDKRPSFLGRLFGPKKE